MTSLADVDSLDQYLQRYGTLLAKQTTERLDPLHVPDRDAPLPILSTLVRAPLPAQAHVITAAVKSLRHSKSVNLIGEMGTGKSLMAIAVAHARANGRPYRALVMAPDHLVGTPKHRGKWEREILKTAPGAIVTTFASWRDVLALCDRRNDPPTGPEWYVLGRDQSKHMPVWEGRATIRPKIIRFRDTTGATVSRRVQRLYCPRCGSLVEKKKVGDGPDTAGVPLNLEDLQKSKKHCKAILTITPETIAPDGTKIEAVTRECREPLWQYLANRTAAHRAAHKAKADAAKKKAENRPYRWAPAKIIHKRLHKWFDYCILDEVHELKSDATAQGDSCGQIAAACKKIIPLTGTIIGGYAWHVYPLIYRTAPRSLVSDGFEWGKDMPFSECYGRIEQQIVTSASAKAGTVVENSRYSTARKIVSNRKVCRPGIMPTLFGDHLMANTIFLGLEEVSDALPPRPTDEVFPVEMDADQAEIYQDLESRISAAIAPMIQRGDITLLAKMLQATLGWPDWPFGWNESRYLEPFDILDPEDLDPSRVFPKERALIDLVKSEANRNRQTWVYIQNTGDRNVQARIGQLLKAEGLRTGVLDRKTVKRQDREKWIHERGSQFDVVVSHPELVKTGLDLFDLDRGVNFATIAWYQVGYNLFTVRQASRRAWRIGQPLDCRVCYFYYTGTMQERNIALMGRKLSATEALDGRFSSEGLAAMASDESAEMALARELSKRVEAGSGLRAWAKHSPKLPPLIPGPIPELRCGDVELFEAIPSVPIPTRSRIKQLSLFGDD